MVEALEFEHACVWWRAQRMGRTVTSVCMEQIWGAGIAQWSEHWTHYRKVAGLGLGRSGRNIFFSRVGFLCQLLFQYPFHPHGVAVAWKILVILPKVQVAGYSSTHMLQHPTYVALHEVIWHGVWLYGVHRMCWDGSSFMQHQSCNNQTALYIHHFGGYSKCTMESYSYSFRITWDNSAVSLLQSGE